MRVCRPNAVSYRDRKPQQIYRSHENEEKRLYLRRVLEIEHGTFTPLVFTTTGGMGLKECLMYHSRLAQLIAIKKGEQYAKTISWIRTRTSFALLRSALVCLRGAYIWRGDLTEGFLRYRFGGLIFGGAYTSRGLFSEL